MDNQVLEVLSERLFNLAISNLEEAGEIRDLARLELRTERILRCRPGVAGEDLKSVKK